jgi:hypothetical protein
MYFVGTYCPFMHKIDQVLMTLKLVTCIGEVPGSDLGCFTSYTG